jgi:ABC-type multidrug transport system permease subunit
MVIQAVLPPLIIFLLLSFLTSLLWKALAKVPKVSPDNRSTKDLTDRIYRNFEFFIKVFLALVGGFGWVRFNYSEKQPELAQQALIGIGIIGMITMVVLVLSVASIQGWKIPRWDTVDWKLLWTWQEIYMMVAMYILASFLWIAVIIL